MILFLTVVNHLHIFQIPKFIKDYRVVTYWNTTISTAINCISFIIFIIQQTVILNAILIDINIKILQIVCWEDFWFSFE